MEFIKKLKLFDYIIIVILVIGVIVGFMTYKGKRATSANQIEASINVDLEIYLRGVTSTSSDSVFKVGDETFITIRNVPYTKLKIKDVKYDRRKVILPVINAKKPYVLVNDETAPYQYDYLVKISDKAKITKDGDTVVGGNKVKIGIPITLEGAKYKLNGVIANVTADLEPENQSSNDLDKHAKVNQDVH